MSTAVLGRLQGGLEQLYRVATGLAVESFLIDDAGRTALGVALDSRVSGGGPIGACPGGGGFVDKPSGWNRARAPREQLLVMESDDGVDLGLYVDADVLANLATHDPGRGLDDRNLAAFLYALEGVSHFVYTAVCAQTARSVSALELELQAEVDKYVTCVLASDGAASATWRRRLYEQCAYEPDLDADERDRYQVANDNARRYAASLERRFVTRRAIVDMFAELRRFYRLPLGGKLDAIARAA